MKEAKNKEVYQKVEAKLSGYHEEERELLEKLKTNVDETKNIKMELDESNKKLDDYDKELDHINFKSYMISLAITIFMFLVTVLAIAPSIANILVMIILGLWLTGLIAIPISDILEKKYLKDVGIVDIKIEKDKVHDLEVRLKHNNELIDNIKNKIVNTRVNINSLEDIESVIDTLEEDYTVSLEEPLSRKRKKK